MNVMNRIWMASDKLAGSSIYIDDTPGLTIQEMRGKARRLKAKGIPSVTVGVPLGEMPQVRSNDHESFYRITEHLIRTHGVKSLWFLKGPEQYDEGTGKPMRERRPAGRSPRRRNARRRWSASMTIWPWERSAR